MAKTLQAHGECSEDQGIHSWNTEAQHFFLWKITFPLTKEEPKDLYRDCRATVHYVNAEHTITNLLLAILLPIIDIKASHLVN